MKTLFTLLLFFTITAARAQTVFYFASSPTSPLEPVQGLEGAVTQSQGGYVFLGQITNIPMQQLDFFNIFPLGTSDGQSWGIEIEPTFGSPFQAGTVYDAENSLFPTGPTVYLGYLAGNVNLNPSAGKVAIFGLSGQDNTITSAAFDFIEYPQGDSSEWNFGSLRYNSDVPVDTLATSPFASSVIPEPSLAAVLFGVASLGLMLLTRFRRAET